MPKKIRDYFANFNNNKKGLQNPLSLKSLVVELYFLTSEDKKAYYVIIYIYIYIYI